jgi:CIC family chloride channel protein
MSLLSANNNPIHRAPLQQMLDRVGVRSIMDTSFVATGYEISYSAAHLLLQGQPRWLVAEELGRSAFLLPAADLATYLGSAPDAIAAEEALIDLREIPARRQRLTPVHQQASLYEAHRRLTRDEIEALYVERPSAPLLSPVLGIITLPMIENYYQL